MQSANQILAEAEQWLARRVGGTPSSADNAAFEAWLAADTRHAASYAEVQGLWDATARLADRPAIRGIRRDVLRATAPRPRLLVPALAAAAALLLMVLAAGSIFLPRTEHYATALGDQRVVTLSDGSKITLDTATDVTVRYSLRQRRIALERGQAYFEVAHDRDRPFTVRTDNGTVTALGTAFDVRRDGRNVTVTLVTGSVVVKANVDVSAAAPGPDPLVVTLTPGEQAQYSANGVTSVRETDTAAVTTWTHGDLVFRDTALADALNEVNRYTTVKVATDDPALATIPINGVFHVGDVDAFLLALHGTFGIEQASDRAPDGSLRIRLVR